MIFLLLLLVVGGGLMLISTAVKVLRWTNTAPALKVDAGVHKILRGEQ